MIAGLIASCENLHRLGVPADCWDDDRTSVSGHWSGTKAAMEAALGRPLDRTETTLLSLSRAYGPTPALQGELMDQLWPNGNSRGGWLEWADLAQELRRVCGQ